MPKLTQIERFNPEDKYSPPYRFVLSDTGISCDSPSAIAKLPSVATPSHWVVV